MTDTQTTLNENWFRSEKSLKQYLTTKGLTGMNGRVYRNGMPLRLDAGSYGQYSQRQWFLHLRETK